LPRCCTRKICARCAGVQQSRSRPNTRLCPPRQSRLFFLFMAGGPSHMETFDPKPLLNELSGQARPQGIRRGENTSSFQSTAKLLAPKYVQEITVGTASTSRICFRTSPPAPTISPLSARAATRSSIPRANTSCSAAVSSGGVPGAPSNGLVDYLWARFRSESLPSYVVMPDPHGALPAGQPMYSQGFLPAVYQPTMFRPARSLSLTSTLPACSLGRTPPHA